MNKMMETIGRLGIVPVVAIEQTKDAEQLGQALIAGGLPCAEITFRTAAAQESIATLATKFPEMAIGAGTVLSVEQAQQAKAAGAKFVVTPGFDVQVVDWCMAHEIPIIPGVLTPTEITMALKKGLNLLKFFPAEASGGLPFLKAMQGPYAMVKFMPTGGVTAANLLDYLRLPNVIACGGSWMVQTQLIAAKRFDEITRLAQEAVLLAQSVVQQGS